MMRIGIIGFGKIARDQHAPAIALHPEMELIGAVSTQPLNLPPPVRCFTDYRDLLASDLKLDAVAICTPPTVRTAIARDCIAAGLDLLLEKPPAATLGEAEEVVRLAAEKKLVLFTTWHAQFNAGVDAARDRLAGKRIKSMAITWKEDVRKWHPGQAWVWDPGNFGVFDPGINALSIAAKIFPGDLIVEAAELRFPAGASTPIAAELSFSSPVASGAMTGSFDWDVHGGETWTIAIDCEDGTQLRLLDGGARLEIDGGPVATVDRGEYPAIYTRFAELVAKRESHVDLRPLRLVADALLRAKRTDAPPFTYDAAGAGPVQA